MVLGNLYLRWDWSIITQVTQSAVIVLFPVLFYCPFNDHGNWDNNLPFTFDFVSSFLLSSSHLGTGLLNFPTVCLLASLIFSIVSLFQSLISTLVLWPSLFSCLLDKSSFFSSIAWIWLLLMLGCSFPIYVFEGVILWMLLWLNLWCCLFSDYCFGYTATFPPKLSVSVINLDFNSIAVTLCVYCILGSQYVISLGECSV